MRPKDGYRACSFCRESRQPPRRFRGSKSDAPRRRCEGAAWQSEWPKPAGRQAGKTILPRSGLWAACPSSRAREVAELRANPRAGSLWYNLLP